MYAATSLCNASSRNACHAMPSLCKVCVMTSWCKACYCKLVSMCHDGHVRAYHDKLEHVCCNRLVAQGEGLLVRWGEEQSQAALQGLHTARQALLDLQAQSQKQRQNQNAKRCTPFHHHSVSLSGLCTGRKAPARPVLIRKFLVWYPTFAQSLAPMRTSL